VVAVDPNSVKIRAEDGRCITCVNISPFIDNLPYGKATDAFTTLDASGSTSQAANIIEALEVRRRLLLFDHDAHTMERATPSYIYIHIYPQTKGG